MRLRGVDEDNQVLVVGLGHLIFDLPPDALGWNGSVCIRTTAIDGEAGLFRDGVQVVNLIAGGDGNRHALEVVPAQPVDHETGEVEVLQVRAQYLNVSSHQAVPRSRDQKGPLSR